MKIFTIKSITAVLFTLLTAFQAQAQITKVEIMATGLTCSMCSNAINKQLKALNEVDRVETDLNTNTFSIFFKENTSVAPRILKEGVEKAGFFVGSMILTTTFDKETAAKGTLKVAEDLYVFLDEDKKATGKFQILDKGYVTQKEYKKLSKSFTKHASYNVANENDYHLKSM